MPVARSASVTQRVTRRQSLDPSNFLQVPKLNRKKRSRSASPSGSSRQKSKLCSESDNSVSDSNDSIYKRRQKYLSGLKPKKARLITSTVSSPNVLDATPTSRKPLTRSNLPPCTPKTPQIALMTPSRIEIMDEQPETPSIRLLGSIKASVSPFDELESQTPSKMYLAQTQKLQDRLKRQAGKLGATVVANSCIVEVELDGRMCATAVACRRASNAAA